MSERAPGGVVHELPADLRHALIANAAALDAWADITPLARNEFICWIEDAKQQPTGNAASAGPRKNWRQASGGRAAGQDASTASEPECKRARAPAPRSPAVDPSRNPLP